MAHFWPKRVRHPCRLGDPHRCRARGKIRSGPLVGKVATSPLPFLGISTAAKREAKLKVARKSAKWLRHRWRLGDPHRFTAGGKIRNGPLVGKVATSPPPSRGSPPLQSGGQNQKWPTFMQSGYVTPAVLGDLHRCKAGGKIESGPQVCKMATSPLPSRRSPPLHSGGQRGYLNPCRLGDPHGCTAGGKIKSGPIVGKLATSPLPSRGSPPLQSTGQNQKWPTSGQGGYVTPAIWGIPTASERGGESEEAQKWAMWLRHPCRVADAHAAEREAE